MAKVRGKKHEGSGGVLSEGDYTVKIFKIEKGKTANKDPKLSFEFVGADKATGKRHFWKDFILKHENPKVVEIAMEQLENLVYCTLGEVDFDTENKKHLKKLVDQNVGIYLTEVTRTKKEKKKGWKDKNEIKYFFEAEEKGSKKKGKKEDKPF